MAKPQCINKYIENIPRNSGNINIVQQLVELILKENPALLEDYQKSKDMTGQMRLEF